MAPTNSSAEAPSIPTCSLPAMGWPPTKRGRSTAATSGPFTLPTSVTTAAGFQSGDGQDVGDDVGGHVHGGGHHHQVGGAVLALDVEGAELHGPGGGARAWRRCR